jgi:hypothetical protein
VEAGEDSGDPTQLAVAQEEESEEVQQVKRAPDPMAPTPQEIKSHEEDLHVQYRSWCKHCIAGRGTGNPHKKRKEPEEAEAGPTISLDYGFMGNQGVEGLMIILFLKDRKSKSKGATAVAAKGVDTGALRYSIGFIRSMGWKRLILKTDGENPIKALKAEIVKNLFHSNSLKNVLLYFITQFTVKYFISFQIFVQKIIHSY